MSNKIIKYLSRVFSFASSAPEPWKPKGTKIKTLGLIGGTSWFSTIEYYRFLNQIVGERLGTHINPPLLLYSLNVELMRRGDWKEIIRAYYSIALNLQNAGAEAFIICANTPHMVIDSIQSHIKIPFIHIADAIGEEAKRLGIRKLALLGTRPVMEEDFIKGKLSQEYSLEILIPDKPERYRFQQIVGEELTQGKFLDTTRQYILEEMKKLKEQGAEGVALACTELPILIREEDFDLPLLNTTFLHAQKAVDFILS